jgi:hypothetical protein
MAKVAGYNASLSFDDGGGAEVLKHVTSSLAMSFDVADVSQTSQAGEDNILTLQRGELSGDFVVEDTTDDAAKDSFEVASFAGTLLTIVYYPTGNSSGNRKYTFTTYVTQFTPTNNGPSGAVGASFTLKLTGGSKITVGTV